MYLEEIKKMFQLDDTHIPVYIFEKPTVNRVEEMKLTKDGIHMIIGLKVDHVCQGILRKRVMAKIAEIWSDLPLTNSWEDVFDEGVTKGGTPWQLYGSRKPNCETYRLKHVFEVSKDPIDNELMYNSIGPDTMETDKNIMKLSARYRKHPYLFMYNDFLEECQMQSGEAVSRNKFVSQKLNMSRCQGQDFDVQQVENSY